MESLFASIEEGAAVRSCRAVVEIRTETPVQFIDLTAVVAERVRRSGIAEGVVLVQSRHTTAAIVVNENEAGLLDDFRRLLERWAPEAFDYRHNDLEARVDVPPGERANGHGHARALLLGGSVTLGVVDGRLDLGEWQSVFLVELDGPRKRSVVVQALGAPAKDRA